jgi:hypothetical protein
LQVWKLGEVEPFFRVAEGSKNEAILHAILEARKPRRVSTVPDVLFSGEGLGRILFERRPSASEKAALWLLGLIVWGITIGVSVFAIQKGVSILVGAGVSIFVILIFLPALMLQRSYFRFHEGGVSRMDLFGVRVLPFEDLAELKTVLMSNDTQLRLVFRPIKGRGRPKITQDLRPTDAALETVRAYIPAEKFVG